MRSNASEAGKSSRARSSSRSSSKRSSGTFNSRRSKTSTSSKAEDGPLESIKTTWREICDEEGISFISMIRAASTKPSLRLEIPTEPILKVVFQDDGVPQEVQVEGDLTDRDIFRSVCSLITSYETISVLRLVDCKLKAEAILVLGNNLTHCANVKELYLDLNPIHGEDFSSLLENNKTLEVLSLKGCAISGQGAELLSDKLSKADLNLKVLNLNTNLIDDKGARALAKGLKWNRRMFFLSLAGNNIGTDGAKYLLEIMKEFPLDSEDLKNRRMVLQERANLILEIVRERKEAFLASLPPMPTQPTGSLTNRKAAHQMKRKADIGRIKSSKSTSKFTSTSEKKKSVKKSDDSQPLAKLRSGSKRTASSVGKKPDNTEANKNEFDPDNMDMPASDDDSTIDTSKFESEFQEDWDYQDNVRRYQEKMISCQLIKNVAAELSLDPAFKHNMMSDVFKNETTGLLCSRGNMTISHLNLAYNKINNDIVEVIMETIWYQEKFNAEENSKKGLKMLLLEGNPVPPNFLADLVTFFKPSKTTLPELDQADTPN